MFRACFFLAIASIACTSVCQCARAVAASEKETGQPSASAVKIINGEAADIRKFPYVASLQYNGTFFGHNYDHFCCGSIISDRHIITSAQCAQARPLGQFHVRVGSSEYYRNGVTHEVEEVIVHPGFDELARDYDVALIKLRRAIAFDKHSKPIKLPRSRDVLEERSRHLSIVGWGAYKLLGAMSDRLLASHVQTIENESCQRTYGDNLITERMFCVFSEGFGPCVGDSGSPAVHKNRLIGLASWSYGCAYENPSVYLRVSSVLGWIKEHAPAERK